jgi:hypothetical protein
MERAGQIETERDNWRDIAQERGRRIEYLEGRLALVESERNALVKSPNPAGPPNEGSEVSPLPSGPVGLGPLTLMPAVDPDGWCEWTRPAPGYQMQCCDCGLVHEVQFQIVTDVQRKPDGGIDAQPVDDPNLSIFFRMRRVEPTFGGVTITTNEAGDCVAVTRTDDEGRILRVLWERLSGGAR